MNSIISTAAICDLKNQIIDANNKYREGTPIMSDKEYDDKVDILAQILGNNFEEFRETLTENSGNVKHPYIMGSLDKIKAFDESASIKKWIYNHIPDNGDKSEGIFVSSKIDGCSARLTYKDGVLIGASTRGDGYNGVDILSKVKNFVTNILPKKFTGNIRGEITLTHETLEQLSEFTGTIYKNLRNATAGLINSKDTSIEEISFLRFFPYEIIGYTNLSKKQQFKKLEELGFTTALHKDFTDIYNPIFSEENNYDNALLAIYNNFLELAPYDIDGLVVCDLFDEEIYENEFIPSKTVAVKFNQMTAESTLIDIQWGVSKSGRLRPVGIIEPVDVGGSTISAVTLNNIKFIKELDLKYGSHVNILKSGDVIPKIVGISHNKEIEESEIEYPTICPSCGHTLSYDIDELYPVCTNKECDDIMINKVLHFMNQLNVKHTSYKTLKKYGIKTISELIHVQENGTAIISTLVKEIYKKVFGVDKETLLSSFDYDGVSEKIIRKLIENYGLDNVLTQSKDYFMSNLPSGVGEKFIYKFINGRNENLKYYNEIISDSRYHCSLKETENNGVLKSLKFVVTGDLNTMSRNEFKNTVINNGGQYQSSITKTTNYLVTNDSSTMTTKIKKAIDNGVKIISEKEFLNMIQHGSEISDFSIF